MFKTLVSHFHPKSLCLFDTLELGCLVCVCCRDPGDCLFLVCAVAIPATVFPLCLCGLSSLISGKVFFFGWEAMAFKHRRRSPGCRDRSGRKVFWQMRSQLTAERSGLASSVLRHMCGRGGIAGVVGTTSLRVCKASISWRCMRRIKNGTLDHRPRVGEKSGSLRSKKRSRGCVRKLSCSASSKERQSSCEGSWVSC